MNRPFLRVLMAVLCGLLVSVVHPSSAGAQSGYAAIAMNHAPQYMVWVESVQVNRTSNFPSNLSDYIYSCFNDGSGSSSIAPWTVIWRSTMPPGTNIACSYDQNGTQQSDNMGMGTLLNTAPWPGDTDFVGASTFVNNVPTGHFGCVMGTGIQ